MANNGNGIWLGTGSGGSAGGIIDLTGDAHISAVNVAGVGQITLANFQQSLIPFGNSTGGLETSPLNAIGLSFSNQAFVAPSNQAIIGNVLLGVNFPGAFSGLGGTLDITNLVANQTDIVMVGNGVSTLSGNTITIGSNTKTLAANTIAIGRNSLVNGVGAIAIGAGATVNANIEATNSIAIGVGAVARSNRAVAIGANANSFFIGVAVGDGAFAGDTSVAVGINAKASALWTTALGATASTSGSTGGIAVGYNATMVNAVSGIAIGNGSRLQSGANDSIAIGNAANVADVNAMAMGASATAVAANSVAIGLLANITNTAAINSIAIGRNARTGGVNCIAIGPSAEAAYSATGNTVVGAIAIGAGAYAGSNSSLAIGVSATATGVNTVSIGSASSNNYPNSVSIGISARGSGGYDVLVGHTIAANAALVTNITAVGHQITIGNPNSGASYSVAMGSNINMASTIDQTSQRSVAIGVNLSTVNGVNSILIGSGSSITGLTNAGSNQIVIGAGAVVPAGNYSIAIGGASNCNGTNAIAIGAGTKTWNPGGTSIGWGANAVSSNSTTLGASTLCRGVSGTAIGNGATVTNLADNSLAIGGGATVNAVNSAAIGFGANTSRADTIQLGVDATAVMAGGNVMFTPEGGLAVKVLNYTGAATIKGTLVTPSTANGAVVLVPVNSPYTTGIFYEDGVANGSATWMVVSGIADVFITEGSNLGDFVRSKWSTDANTASGYATAEAAPTTPFATDKHWAEIGHALTNRTDAGLIKVVLHFN